MRHAKRSLVDVCNGLENKKYSPKVCLCLNYFVILVIMVLLETCYRAISPTIVLIPRVPDLFFSRSALFLQNKSGTCVHKRALTYTFGVRSGAIALVPRGSGT